MMKRLQRWVAVSAVLALAATTAAAAAVVTRVFTYDESAYAQYFQNSTDGCVSMSLEVFSSDSMTRYNDTSTALPTVRAQLFSYNYCTGEFIFMSGVDEAPALFTNKDLSLATASATVPMMDEFGNTQTVVVDLKWSGGVFDTDKYRTVFTSPRSRTMIKSVGSVRQSDSVSGSLVLDGLNLLGPENPTSGSGLTGFVTSSKGSTIDIIRY